MFAGILPYIDQATVYNRLNWMGSGLPTSATGDTTHDAATQTVIPAYLCPSSTTTSFLGYSTSATPPGGTYPLITAFGATQYVGIMGSTQNGAFTNRSNTGTFFLNSKVSIAKMTDGSSNVLVVGEYSGLAKNQPRNANGTAGPGNLNQAAWYGMYDTGGDTAGATNNAAYKAVVFAPNFTWYEGTGLSAACTQSLKSQHVGGFHGLLGDGTVRFISENVSMPVLRNLADIADGATVSDF